ncbi:DUF1573 domain-containing protein [Hazenella sp. IB182357]|uniref:DUF1573 domain-containing protein n=1 Tax=Polycladospora coralii TaxID=2771432 RepID=A0A926NBP1_9BACL|nr:DUF1573 domain-containing protein [Polycladospora coralii]MBD1372395.1 DUF1573 domain-containing protein [Polycladospora coralii]MBS7531415.1 DUF1573 domain-containing protein [Polycladospora coralii]
MSEKSLESFQTQVSDLLIRHRSFLDVTSKFQESNARVNRALMKSVTDCGCIKVDAKKQNYPDNSKVSEWSAQLSTHLDGKLCDHCHDVISAEIGKNIFYLTSVCNLLDLKLADVLEKESDRLFTLGVYHLR